MPIVEGIGIEGGGMLGVPKLGWVGCCCCLGGSCVAPVGTNTDCCSCKGAPGPIG